MDSKNQANELKKEIKELNKDLNEVNKQKESWFQIKESLKKEISFLIKKLKSLNPARGQEQDKNVRRLKHERDSYNKRVKELIESHKELSKKKEDVLKNKKINFDPQVIAEKIEILNKKIETEALPFEREKKVMSEIKQLNKLLEESKEAKDILKDIKKVSEEIKIVKQKADESHKKLISELSNTRQGYSEFQVLAKQVSDLKKKQEDAFKKFIDSKNEFAKINDDLKVKLTQARGMHSVVLRSTKIKKSIRLKSNNNSLEIQKRLKEIEAKVKRKEKLTTEDLLIYQNK